MNDVIKLPVNQTGINAPSGNPSDILRKPECRRMMGGISPSTFDRLVRSKRLPKPLKIGFRAVGWYRSDIQSYLDSLNAERSVND